VKTECNVGAELEVDWLYEHLCAEEKTLSAFGYLLYCASGSKLLWSVIAA